MTCISTNCMGKGQILNTTFSSLKSIINPYQGYAHIARKGGLGITEDLKSESSHSAITMTIQLARPGVNGKIKGRKIGH